MFQHEKFYSAEGSHVTESSGKKKKKGLALKIICGLLAVCLVGGIATVHGYAEQSKSSGLQIAESHRTDTEAVASLAAENEVAAATLLKADSTSSSVKTASEIYEENVSSTVGITVSGTVNYWGYTSQYAASGSGFIVTSDGYILTNYHVVEGSSDIQVTLYSGESYPATVIGYDSDNDIALLKIDATGLTPVTLGNSDDLKVGEEVYAIGNPLGELTFSMTRGIVSALNREVTLSTGTMKLIQTDCSINSGNSGGALFNQYGEVIGITNAKYSSSSSSSASIDNICFAIPMNNVIDIVESLVTSGTYEKPYIGVTVTDASEQVLSVAGLESGAMVQSVTEGAPAANAGLQVNDIVTAANGKAVNSSEDLVEIVSDCQPGDQLILNVYRSGQTGTVTITVSSKTESASDTEASTDFSSQQSAQSTNPFGYGQQSGSDPFGSSNSQGNLNPFGSYGSQGNSGSQSNSGNSMEDFFNYYFGNN